MNERADRVDRLFDVPMLIVAAPVIPVIVIEQSDVSAGWKPVGQAIQRRATAAERQ